MHSPLLLWALLVAYTQSICSGSLFWDPFDNACVSRNSPLTQSAPGNLPFSTTRTPPPTSACRPAPRLLVSTPTILPNPVWPVPFCLSSACPWDATYKTYYDNYYRRCVLSKAMLIFRLPICSELLRL